MESVDVLRAEHEAVLVVLQQLERAVAAAEQGAPVAKDIFTDIQEFFKVFVDHCHHGKEEAEVFPRLGSRAWDLVRRLEMEHTRGRDLAEAYAEAVQAYTPGDAASGSGLAAAARDYADFLHEHIMVETVELFPAMESALEREDRDMVDAFERIEVERIGAGTHERLHGMIESLGPRIDPYVR